eukprot:748886-Hanusia_phi.AAC.2
MIFLSDLTCLTWLELHTNSLEKLPDEIGKLVDLRGLSLHENKLTALPSSLANLERLTLLTLAGTAVCSSLALMYASLLYLALLHPCFSCSPFTQRFTVQFNFLMDGQP